MTYVSKLQVQRRPLTILIKINLPKVTAPIKLGPVLEEPRPQPQSPSPDTPEVGAVISKLICVRHKLKNCFVVIEVLNLRHAYSAYPPNSWKVRLHFLCCYACVFACSLI